MRSQRKIKLKIIALSLAMIFLLGIAILVFCQHFNQEMSQRNVVKIKTNDESTVLFYRDDCQNCKSIFSYIVMEKELFGKNIQLVNTNQPKNRHYISEYKLTKVPTFVHLKYGKKVENYSGTSIKKIDQVLRGD